MDAKRFNCSVHDISCRPDVDLQVHIEYHHGELRIISTLNPSATVDLLDKAMEAIDGCRLPPRGR